MRLLVPTTLCALALLGCGSATAASAAATTVHDFRLAYKRTGGVASSTQTLAVRPGRRATATTSGTPTGRTRTEFRLDIRRVRSLQRSLSQADLDSIPPAGPSGCADCYAYDLRYDGHHLELEEVDVPPRLRAVFDEIDAIIVAHAAAPVAPAARG
ncbi:MAG TPA: hypothetical protein VJL81_00120 [Solirubrobacterales bacterium]|nr:hypothetical protein [Solirubrobacterales bacterium]